MYRPGDSVENFDMGNNGPHSRIYTVIGVLLAPRAQSKWHESAGWKNGKDRLMRVAGADGSVGQTHIRIIRRRPTQTHTRISRESPQVMAPECFRESLWSGKNLAADVNNELSLCHASCR